MMNKYDYDYHIHCPNKSLEFYFLI